MSQQSIAQFKKAHTAVYGGTGLEGRVTEEQAGHAAAWEASRKLKESGQPVDGQNLPHTLEAMARQQADRIVTTLGLHHLDDQEVKRHAAAAAVRIAPDFVSA
ncbi:DUF3759 domain-containing protein [Streptomyces monashensis]|uniref:DUF3759 domain-containing protein n=1 Tax=Streptomyces monashensis TaxID=1678012 RepID=UPI0033E61322